jgi:2-aminoadipate transaminase
MPPSTRLSQRAAWSGQQPISYLMHKALADPGLISLAAGFVNPATLPVDSARRGMERLFSDAEAARAALQYGTTSGFVNLREQLLARFLEADPPGIPASRPTVQQVVLTAGSNQLLHLAAETLFDPGDICLTTAPTYFVFLGLLSGLGVRTVGVEMDHLGLIPESLAETLEQLEREESIARVKAVYIVSYFDNPCSVTLAAERRVEILEVVSRFSRHHRIHVIEDGAYRELRYSADDVPSLRSFDEDGRTVIWAGTFSKSFSPGLRVGYGILPADLVGPILKQKGNIDFGSPNLSQHFLARLLESGDYEPHVAAVREGYRVKLSVMLEALEEWFGSMTGVSWIRPAGGLYVWLKLPAGIDAGQEGRLFDRALKEGVLYVPGQYCFPSEGRPVERNTIRLSFGVPTIDQIRTGVRLLARAVESDLSDGAALREPSEDQR